MNNRLTHVCQAPNTHTTTTIMSEPKEPRGIDALLERFDAAIDGPNEDPQSTGPPREDTESEHEPDNLDELNKVKTPTSVPVSDDPLDNLDPEPKPEPEPGTEDTPKAGDDSADPVLDGDFLDALDASDKDKLQEYIDAKVANEVTEGKSANGAFRRLKAENRELKSQVDLIPAVDDSTPEALTAATKRIEELESQVQISEDLGKVTNLEATQAWADNVVHPLQSVLVASDKIAARYGVDKHQLSATLEIEDRQAQSTALNKLFDDAGVDVVEADKFELFDLARHVDSVYRQRDVLRSNAHGALEEANALVLEQHERSALAERQGREASVAEVVSRFESKVPELVDIVGKEELAAAAKSFAETPDVTPDNLAYNEMTAKAFIPLLRRIRSVEAENAELSDELSAHKSAIPGAGGGGGFGGETKVADDAGTGQSWADRVTGKLSAQLGS